MYKLLIMVLSPGQKSNEGKIFPCREGESIERASARETPGKRAAGIAPPAGITGLRSTDA